MKKALATLLILTAATVAQGIQNPPEWMRYTSAEGRYSVLVPREPKLTTQEITAQTGEKLAQYRATSTDSTGAYVIGYSDYPATMTFSLDKGRDGFVGAVKGTLLSEEAISLGGHPGREFKVSVKVPSGEDVLMRVRCYDIGRRVYFVVYAHLMSIDASTVSEKAARFFDSFKIVMGQ